MQRSQRRIIRVTDDGDTYLVTLEGWRRILYRLTLPVLVACCVVVVLDIFGDHLGWWARVAGLLGILSIALDLLFLKGPEWILAPSQRLDDKREGRPASGRERS